MAHVPENFRVGQPTAQDLAEREATARARGVRPIESPWPSQERYPLPADLQPRPPGGHGYQNRMKKARGGHQGRNNANHPKKSMPILRSLDAPDVSVAVNAGGGGGDVRSGGGGAGGGGNVRNFQTRPAPTVARPAGPTSRHTLPPPNPPPVSFPPHSAPQQQGLDAFTQWKQAVQGRKTSPIRLPRGPEFANPHQPNGFAQRPPMSHRVSSTYSSTGRGGERLSPNAPRGPSISRHTSLPIDLGIYPPVPLPFPSEASIRSSSPPPARQDTPQSTTSQQGTPQLPPSRHASPTGSSVSPPAYPTQSGGGSSSAKPMFSETRQRRHLQSPAYKPSIRHNRQQPLLLNNEWKKLPEIGLHIGPGLKTDYLIDLYHALSPHGEVERMEIFKDDQNAPEGTARAYMRKVKFAFWDSGRIRIPYGEEGQETMQWVPIRLMEPSRSGVVSSPMNPNKKFKEKYSFPYTDMNFGFMIEPQTMMVMHTATGQPEPDPTAFEVDFYRKQLKIFFKVAIPVAPKKKTKSGLIDNADGDSPSGAQDAGTPDGEPAKPTERIEMFRLEVPFAHLGHLVMSGEGDETHRTIVIPLSSPPRYGRRTHDKAKSIDENVNFWSANEIWMRQVAIEPDMKAIRAIPISLQHKSPIIDIGRWTTFRLALDLTEGDLAKEFNEMIDAILDYNVETKKFVEDEFKTSFDRESLKPIWEYLDGSPSKDTTSYMSDLAEFTRPALSYPVRYQLEVCISNEILNEFNLTPEFVQRLASMSEKDALSLLEHVAEMKVRYFIPMEIFEIPKREIRPGLSSRNLPEYCALMRRGTVTPGGLVFGTPSVETTNRVIRHYSMYNDRFLRVSFSDEKFFGRINGTDKMTLNEVFTRVFRALKQGITIGGRTFEFLAFGNSQLREHGAYFFASNSEVCANDIRAWMGDFKGIRIVAKCASRLGQCFSTTRALNSCIPENIEIPDLEFNGYVFSDGVGKITPLLAHMVSWELKVPKDSTCFQFRLGGNKGVLTVDDNMHGANTTRTIHTRPSQRKFDSNHTGLEIVRCSQFTSASLNRQLIILMSSLGVPDEVFESRLKLMLEDYHLALEKPKKALELLTKHIDPNQMTLQVAQLVRSGFMESREPFVMSLMHLWRAWTIKYLKEKAKISLDHGAFVLGVVDETAELKGYYDNEDMDKNLPEIFLQISDTSVLPDFDAEGNRRPTKETTRIITGPVVVARNPSLHPGDVRLVMAVDKPSLHHLVDVVVFPQTGDRPVPSMLSGGDLDGDDYIIIWDEDFTAHVKNQVPASYTAAPPMMLDRNVEIADIAQFFVNYMKNDRLGTIANNHLAWADKLWDGVKSPQCLELAQLHSDAVDYPKSGVPAVMKKALKCSRYPHFMEKDIDRSYRSTKVLGRLYDMVEKVDFVACYHLPFSKTIINAFKIPDAVLVEMREVKDQYDAAVRRVLAQHDIKTEMEIWSTFALSHAGGRDYMFHEELGRIATTLKDRFRKIVIDKAGENRHTSLPPYVAAMYIVTANEVNKAKLALWKKQRQRRKAVEENGEVVEDARELVIGKADAEAFPFMSFPWLFPEVLSRILRTGGSKEEGAEMTMEEWEEVVFEVLEPDGVGGLRNRVEVEVEEEEEEEEEDEDPEGTRASGNYATFASSPQGFDEENRVEIECIEEEDEDDDEVDEDDAEVEDGIEYASGSDTELVAGILPGSRNRTHGTVDFDNESNPDSLEDGAVPDPRQHSPNGDILIDL